MKKRCTKCGIEKDESHFYKDKTHKDGLTSLCKECRSQVSSAWREVNREQYRAYHRSRVKRGQSYLDTLKTNCCKCGETRPYVIQFHHVDPSMKLFTIASSGVHRSEALIKQEVSKCVCLCSNCHAEYHWLYGKRPAQPLETLTEYLGKELI